MRKTFAVFKREYLQTVKKKSFIVMTILSPFLMLALSVIPGLLVQTGMGGKRVAVVDGTGRLSGVFTPQNVDSLASLVANSEELGPLAGGAAPAQLSLAVDYTDARADIEGATKNALAHLAGTGVPEGKGVDGVLVIPATAFDDPSSRLTYYSRAAADMLTQDRLGRLVNRAVQRERLTARGLDPGAIESLMRGLRVDPIQLSRSGEVRKGGELDAVAALIFGALLFIPMLMYGMEVMRGILQEKGDRVVEILISAMSPMELLSGKILGLAAVGLTQVAVWMSMGLVAASYVGAMALAAGVDLGKLLRLSLVPYFVAFYLLGYMVYVCVYAVAGAIANSEKEAQQAMAPVMMVVMAPWFLLGPILLNPESTLTTVLSLIPLFTPVLMFLRILLADPPFWQIALSIVLTSAMVYGMFWLTAKIFRLGILSYGKRPTVRELWQWVRVA